MTRIVMIPNGQFAQNCYLLAPDDSPAGVIIDPGEESDRILARARHEGIDITAIWLTHAHLDHVLGVGAVREATNAEIHLHPADRALYDATPEQGRWFGFEVAAPPAPHHELAHGDTLALGEVAIAVRHAPGHSPGSVCFVGPDFVIGGDVVFQGSIGRTDLPGGDFDQLIRSIREQVLTLPDATVVYSGHGPVTTVGEERAGNPFLRPAPR